MGEKVRVVVEDQSIDVYRLTEPGKPRVQRPRTLAVFICDCRNMECQETFCITEDELAKPNRKVFHSEECRKRYWNQLEKEVKALGAPAVIASRRPPSK